MQISSDKNAKQWRDKERHNRPGSAGAVRGDSRRKRKHVHFHCSWRRPPQRVRRTTDGATVHTYSADSRRCECGSTRPPPPRTGLCRVRRILEQKQSWRRTQNGPTAPSDESLRWGWGSGPNTTCWAVVPLCAGTASGSGGSARKGPSGAKQLSRYTRRTGRAPQLTAETGPCTADQPTGEHWASGLLVCRSCLCLRDSECAGSGVIAFDVSARGVLGWRGRSVECGR